MKVAVVTSCSAQGWQKYGKRCVETFLKFWPIEVDLYLVSEDDIDTSSLRYMANLIPRRFQPVDLNASADARAFMERHKENPKAHGYPKRDPSTWRQRQDPRDYLFRYDAYKFCKKVFAIELVAGMHRPDVLIWLDADTVTHAPVPMSLIDSVLHPDAHIAALMRSGYHSECGFVVYNLRHSYTRVFISTFAKLYATDDVFKINEWHDSFVFDWLCENMKMKMAPIPSKDKSHPFAHSELGLYMDHLKGARKNYTWSPDHPKFGTKGHMPWRRK